MVTTLALALALQAAPATAPWHSADNGLGDLRFGTNRTVSRASVDVAADGTVDVRFDTGEGQHTLKGHTVRSGTDKTRFKLDTVDGQTATGGGWFTKNGVHIDRLTVDANTGGKDFKLRFHGKDVAERTGDFLGTDEAARGFSKVSGKAVELTAATLLLMRDGTLTVKAKSASSTDTYTGTWRTDGYRQNGEERVILVIKSAMGQDGTGSGMATIKDGKWTHLDFKGKTTAGTDFDVKATPV